MAYTPLRISIADPCHEDWNDMHLVSGTTERHCDSCAKNVIDFTSFTDVQMNAYVRLNPGKICGRFRPDQLGRPLRAVTRSKSSPLKIAATAAGLMLAASGCDTVGEVQQIANEDADVIELLEGLVLDPPQAGKVSFEKFERPKTCLAPATNGPVRSKVGEPHSPPPPQPEEWEEEVPQPPVVVKVGKPEIIDMVGEYNLEEVEWPEDSLFEIEEQFVPPPPPPRPKVGMITISIPEDLSHDEDSLASFASEENFPNFEGNETVSEGLNDLHEEFEFVAPEVLEARAYQNPQQEMLMGMVSYQRPEPTGLDWVKDSLLKTILPPFSAPQTTASHQRPRPNDLPQHLKNLTVYPNPFVSELVVVVELPHAQTMVVELLGPNGRRIHVESFEGIEGGNSFVIEPKRRKLVHTAYHLRVTDLLGQVIIRTVVR